MSSYLRKKLQAMKMGINKKIPHNLIEEIGYHENYRWHGGTGVLTSASNYLAIDPMPVVVGDVWTFTNVTVGANATSAVCELLFADKSYNGTSKAYLSFSIPYLFGLNFEYFDNGHTLKMTITDVVDSSMKYFKICFSDSATSGVGVYRNEEIN